MDRKIAERIRDIVKYNRNDCEKYVLAIDSHNYIYPVPIRESKKWFAHKKDIQIPIPKLSDDNELAIAELALAIGRRLDRYERAIKANAGRSAEVRKKIAQNAIKSRWASKQSK